MSRRLAAAGHDLLIGYRSDEAAARAIAADARSLGRAAAVGRVDVADSASVDAFFQRADEIAPITGLVSNAGEVTTFGRLEDLDPVAMRHDLDVLVLGVLLCCRAAVPRLRAVGGGAITTISSGAATLGSAGEFVHYAAAKAAVDAATLGLAREVAREGIRVNAVAPGLVDTAFHPDPARLGRLAPTVPMGRAARPEEIANAVAWLMSDEASYTTGAVLRVAGGR